jgi:PPOX class probable F420-dependent enzyme
MALPERVAEFLQNPYLAVLGTLSPTGWPQVTPVWFLYEDGYILINTSKGRAKLRNVELNPRISLTIVDPNDAYQYVQVLGKVVKFDWPNGARDIDRLSMRYRGHPHRYRPGDGPGNRVTLFIKPIRTHTNGFR